MNIKLTVAYEGTRYLGWQKTEMGPSIEAELEKALAQILQHPVKLQAASRTDAGVHAAGQIVNFFTETKIELKRLQKSLNSLLPDDISVREIETMPEPFHPTLDCTGKQYEYSVCLGTSQLPFQRLYSWHFPYPIDLEQMALGARSLTGRHDFSAFTNEKQEDNLREIYSIEIIPEETGVKIRVEGNAFLYKMVRNIAGTLVYVGCGKLKASALSAIIESKDRTRAGVTAPAHGLTLKKVNYD
jgi:tRNA pseudouridine38-40 synthase